ncbi:MAG: endolytic transglycosylase MltG [Bacteroidales bacterium]|nr:endolytic transglycosylase MltG [Bacteroidales bacterium]
MKATKSNSAKGGKLIVWIAAGAVVLAACALFLSVGRAFYDRRVPNFKGVLDLYVYPGETVADVQARILESPQLRRKGSIRRCLAGTGEIRPGHYRVDGTCSSMYVARMLRAGWQTPVSLTLSGTIRNREALARKIGSQMLADSASVMAFLSVEDSVKACGVTSARQLFSFIIPDTYEIVWTATPGEILRRLVAERNAWWNKERRAAAAKQGLSPLEVSALASIVAGESQYVPEQPKIAGVYLNRLRKGMKLQADPTVAYCFNYEVKRILHSHLEVDSPYNTYKYAGLPPGPIQCPPKSCLEAVLHPDNHSYLYFCADPSFNGSHRFASSYEDHLANGRAYREALSKRK